MPSSTWSCMMSFVVRELLCMEIVWCCPPARAFVCLIVHFWNSPIWHLQHQCVVCSLFFVILCALHMLSCSIATVVNSTPASMRMDGATCIPCTADMVFCHWNTAPPRISVLRCLFEMTRCHTNALLAHQKRCLAQHFCMPMLRLHKSYRIGPKSPDHNGRREDVID